MRKHPEAEREMMDMVKRRLGIQPMLIETIEKLRTAKTAGDMVESFKRERLELLQGGGPEAIKRQHKLGRLTARERIGKLVDEGSFSELDFWHRPYETGFNIGEERGRGDGVVVGYARVNARPISLWAQDATVMGGTVGTVHARKVNMIMRDALNARAPIVGILDSEGIRAHDVIQYPEFYSTSTMANLQTRASGVIPTIALVMGPCTGDLALIASLSNFVFMVRNTSYMHLAPPPAGITSQELGDPWNVHAKVSGCCDVLCNDEEDCLKKCRQLLSFLPLNNTQKPPVVDTGDDPNRREDELLTIVPTDSRIPYNMYRIISLIVDNGEFFEIKRYWARNDIVGFARFGGRTVGLIASNPQDKGGCMSIDAASKQANFTRFCDAFNIPVVWLGDCPAFLPAVDEEKRGLIRTASGMIMANSELTVPQITIFIRKLYGGGQFGSPGKLLGGDLQVAWPTFEPGLMSPEAGSAVIYGKELGAIQDPVERARQTQMRVQEMLWGNIMQARERTQTYIDPRDTRPFIINALNWMENRQEDIPKRKHENFRT